jgi:MFS transporter, DHA3 family, tetracycline resistance protein
MGRWRAGTIWLAMWSTDGFFFHLDSTVYSVFLILQVGLDPLQLVLMGTILEVSYLLFEIPTGIMADSISRKWSIVIGYLGTGAAFVLLGVSDSFAVAAASQVLYGVSATFVSGADVAWLTDEVGRRRPALSISGVSSSTTGERCWGSLRASRSRRSRCGSRS